MWLIFALVDGALENSVTVDEFAHLPAGLFYWQTGDFSAYRHNPPLLRLLAAAPLAAAGIRAPEDGFTGNRWLLGKLFQKEMGARYHRIFFPARMVIALLTVINAVLLFTVTCRSIGREAGLVALALFCFNPLVLAHGALVTTDAGFCLAFFATCVTAACFFRSPSWMMTLLLGGMLGAAQLTKFTALLLFPLLLVAALVLPWLAERLNETERVTWLDMDQRGRWLRLGVAFLVALLVLDAGYLFQGVGQPLFSYPQSSRFLRALVESPLGILPCPLPAEYMLGFEDQYREASGTFTVYLLGHLTTRGWWYYYPLALLFKLPFMFIILSIGVVGALAARKVRSSLLLVSCLAVLLLTSAAFVLFTNIDIGVRYLLFLVPFACIAIAHLAAPPLSRYRMAILGLCLALYALGVAVNHPHYIDYFSEVCGGASRGHLFLADSNLDWGQDLIRLGRYMRENRISSVGISHFGLVDPAVYGVRTTPLSAPGGSGIVVISVNHLLGVDPWNRGAGVEPYRGRKPRARIGYSLWVFDRITDPMAGHPPEAKVLHERGIP